MRPSHLIPILLFLSCAFSPSDNQEGIDPYFIIHDYPSYRWFRDSTLNDFICPAEWDTLNPGDIVIHTDLNYCETEFPDTFWGVYSSYIFPNETLSCVQCDCDKINDTVVYDMQWYFDSLNIFWSR